METFIRATKSRRMKWAVHDAFTGKLKIGDYIVRYRRG
jgi:hypothetical protein